MPELTVDDHDYIIMAWSVSFDCYFSYICVLCVVYFLFDRLNILSCFILCDRGKHRSIISHRHGQYAS